MFNGSGVKEPTNGSQRIFTVSKIGYWYSPSVVSKSSSVTSVTCKISLSSVTPSWSSCSSFATESSSSRLPTFPVSSLIRLSLSSCYRSTSTHSVIFFHTIPNTVTLSLSWYVFFWLRSWDLLCIMDIFTSVCSCFTWPPRWSSVLVLIHFSAFFRHSLESFPHYWQTNMSSTGPKCWKCSWKTIQYSPTELRLVVTLWRNNNVPIDNGILRHAFFNQLHSNKPWLMFVT